MVRIGYLTGIRVSCKPGGKGFRRFIALVWVVIMQEVKESLVLIFPEPVKAMFGGFTSPSLRGITPFTRLFKTVMIQLESLVEAEL